uniref:RWD domain-containing protein n=1 Tax=Macrostomum lignano TaxID=282301 RepID=A0A1I8I5Z1_9PLAT
RQVQSLAPRCEPPKRDRLLEQLLPATLTSEQAAVKAALIGGSPGVRAFSAEVWRNRAGTRLLTLRAFVPQDSTAAQQPPPPQQQTLSSSSKCRVLETRPLPDLNLLASSCLEIISAYTESQLPQDFLPIVCNRPADFVRQLQQANQNGMHDSIDKIIIVPCLHAAMSEAVSNALAETPACQTILSRCRSCRCSRRRGNCGHRQILGANRRLTAKDDDARPKKADVNCNDLLDDQEAPTATDGEGNDDA